MKRAILLLINILIIQLCYSQEVAVKNFSYHIDDDLLNYDIELENQTEKLLLLTNIKPFLYTYYNDELNLLFFETPVGFLFGFLGEIDESDIFAQNVALLEPHQNLKLNGEIRLANDGVKISYLSNIEKQHINWSNAKIKRVNCFVGYTDEEKYFNKEMQKKFDLFMNQKIPGNLSVKNFCNFPFSKKYRYIFNELKNSGLEREGLYFCKIFVNSIAVENTEITENEIADFFDESRKAIKKINFGKNKRRDFSFENISYIFSWLRNFDDKNAKFDNEDFHLVQKELIKKLIEGYKKQFFDDYDFSYYFTNWFLWNYSAAEQEEHRKNLESFMNDDKSCKKFVSYWEKQLK